LVSLGFFQVVQKVVTKARAYARDFVSTLVCVFQHATYALLGYFAALGTRLISQDSDALELFPKGRYLLLFASVFNEYKNVFPTYYYAGKNYDDACYGNYYLLKVFHLDLTYIFGAIDTQPNSH